MLTNFALAGSGQMLGPTKQIAPATIDFGVALSAAIFVILQELKFHNFGGRNVYDFNDIIFSIIGLLLALAYLILKRPDYGILCKISNFS